ncbi:hypothetical protein [Clostridium folliculivorans]|uniref:Uncharacterized protein n=1 Tax=Clostridium folliculivorans TaxID=2886038 RepID=A0A9W5XZ97_9CLOT|nr:hypothetical protein [Clostridium folliculivorans]GKU23660.1 hypothetical protein CFOLD11_04860 [Clostridium folliculivorans]GKU29776.1 hypothetical protein CFB3_18830 [Clostridium folliculivorans]
MYSYYKKIDVEEQMLFDSEIARLFKIYSVANKKDFGEVIGKPHYALVKVILDEYIKENNIELEELYYPTYLGMGQVYPESVYNPAIERFLEEHYWYDLTQTYTSKDGKEYKFVWVKNRI